MVEGSFNPTLVRLRQASLEATLQELPRFQSHAGSIEAIELASYSIPAITFQSHAGSIEAPRDTASLRHHDDVSIPRWFD